MSSFLPEKLLDRAILKNSLLRWKTLSIVLFITFIVILFGNIDFTKFPSLSRLKFENNIIAKIKIEGIIVQDFDREKILINLSKNPKIKAVILYINSPGGTIVGGETLYNTLRKISLQKPLVVLMGDSAASGAYMASLAADRIFSSIGTITGSIGVILQTFNGATLLENIGIEVDTVKSAPLKGLPSNFEKLSPEAKKVLQETIDQETDYFISLVAERRNMSIEEAQKLSDGRIYLGKQALKESLIDEIGTEEDALLWLKSEKKIEGIVKDYSLYSPTKKNLSFFTSVKNLFSITNKIHDFLTEPTKYLE